MLKFDDKEYRNLQEQVLKNMQDIEALKKKAELADLGINIVTPEPFASASQLPLPYAGGYGDGFLVGTEAPYTLYIWTRESNEYNGEWFKWGLLNAPSVIPGPIGPQGIQGETGQRGSQWNSQTGNPTNVAGQLNYDQALNTQTGDVFQFVNGVWQKTGNIRGPQGIQGIAGPPGEQGPQGEQGLQGPTGPQGQFIEIVGTLENTGQLPAPATVARSTAYLVTVDGAEHIYLIIGEGTEESPLVWHDAGAFGAGSGTKVMLGGVQQEQVNLDSLTVPNKIYNTSACQVWLISGEYVQFTKNMYVGKNLLGAEKTTSDISISLPIGNSPDIIRKSKNLNGGQRLVFELSDTYKNQLAQDIANAGAQSVVITAPSTATNGQLSEADFATLNGSPKNFILFNNEVYLAQDRQHDAGFLTYTHVGYDNTVNDYIIKCITITVNTRGWVLTSIILQPKLPTGISITINNEGSSCVVYDGTSTAGKAYELSASSTNNVVIQSGYAYVIAGGAEFFASEPTVSGDITIEEYTGTTGHALFKVSGTGTISFGLLCFVEGTNILLANGSTKPVEDITYDDELLVWDFYNGEQATARPMWIMQKQSTVLYYKITLSDGTILKLVGSNGKSHRLYNVEQNAFIYPQDFAANEHTVSASGELLTIISIKKAEETVNYYNVITDKHYNLYAENILTSCRLSNRYAIKDMKYDTTDIRMSEEEVEAYIDRIQSNKSSNSPK